MSGATAAIESRLSWVARFVPFPLLEASHFLGSIVGVGLLFLARAVARRIDAAWTLSVAGVAAGIAPLSGLEPSTLSPPWTPVVRYLCEHGEGFYKFQGLRAYQEKFDPDWDPRYLAYPGRLALARVVADVSALIAGGYRRIFFKAS